MTPQRWQQVKLVFEAVRDLPAAARAGQIAARCGDDEDLQREVESLLLHLSRATGFLEMPAAPAHSSISAALDAPAPPPQQIGLYRVERELGRGGMGVVYLARDPALDRAVAIKVLPQGFARDRDRLLRFEREARILASLNHPGIASIYSLEQAADGSRFLVLEYVPGSTLAQRLQTGPLAIDEALHACAQICRGLEAAHGRGVIHRDLKPDNIRITPAGLVKVLDFGLARRADPSTSGLDSGRASVATQAGLVLGTPGYMSPEQARGMPLDERTDVFAFGCLLYACLTGRPAFGGETAGDCLAAVLREEADLSLLPPKTPARVRDLLARCLAKEVDQRVRDIGLVRREIEAAILELGAGSRIAGPSPFATVMRLHAPPTNNLPRQLTTFVGRERELVEVQRLLERGSLLTLTGAGGCGKTRLALRVAAELLDRFPGGVWFVELASLTDASLVPAAAATTVGVKEEPGRPLVRSLIERLEARRVLLLLDNCEHLLAAVGELVRALLQACPDLKIIATSREGLGIAGETGWRVPSLSMPDPSGSATAAQIADCEAVRLFVERAAAVQPGFVLTDSAAPHGARICARLDGIPLAIELAAARVKVLSAEQISAKLSDRFRLLVGGSRTALERHQTLRAAIDWSYGLLSEPERRVLRALSVFAGGCTLDAAVAVCGGDEFDALDVLTHLVDKSLVIAQEDPTTRQVRYRLLETVRQYAREKLHSEGSAEPQARQFCERHAMFYVELSGRAEPELFGKDQQSWLERLDAEHENLLAALEWCAGAAGPHEADAPDAAAAAMWAERGLRLAGASGRFWNTRGHLAAGRAAVRLALERDTAAAPTPARAKALNAAGSAAYLQGDFPAAQRFWEDALAIHRHLGNQRAMAGALNNLGLIAESRGDYPRGRTLYEEALAINRDLGNRPWEAININNLGNIAWNERDYPAARDCYERALAINRELGNRGAEAQNLNNLGSAARESGDDVTARAHYREALRIKRELGDRRGIAVTLGQLGLVAASQGDLATSGKIISDALLMRRELGDRQGIAMSLEEASVLACAAGEPERACRLFAAADGLRSDLASPLAAGERTRSERGLGAARAAMDQSAFESAWRRGKAQGWSRLCDEALAWLGTVGRV